MFHALEVVGGGSETQIQVGENYSYLLNLRANICIFYVHRDSNV